MSAHTTRHVAVFAVAVIMVVSTMGLLAMGGFGAAAPAPAVSATSHSTQSTASPGLGSGLHASSATADNLATTAGDAALKASIAAGIPSRDVLPPRPSASPEQLAQTAADGHVTPLYASTPAPIGLADYGLSASANGSIIPSILNTTSVQATVDTNSTGIVPNDLFTSSPDGYGIQLNSVTTNVTLFGQSGYSFWTQNVVELYQTSGLMYLVTNVWNFSGPSLSSNVFYAHGPDGTQVGTEYYYSEILIPFPVFSPFNLTLTMTNSIIGGRNAVNFTVELNTTHGNVTEPYDFVIFNSTAPGGQPLTTPSQYTANGHSYNPMHLTNDFEVILGGPGGGSQADLFAADAHMTLSYWNGNLTAGSYHAVPSAYSYGGETGETVTGASVAWSAGPGGSPVGIVSGGPAILHGLWNATGLEGAYPVSISVSPSNAFIFVTRDNSTSANFTISEPEWFPTVVSSTTWLSPGHYTVDIVLSNAQPILGEVTVTHASVSLTFNLTADPSVGIITPLWAWSNAQFPAISTGGNGTPGNPFVIVNDQSEPLNYIFGQVNDYAFPVFAGVFFQNTNANVELKNPANLSVNLPSVGYPYVNLPATNQLQMWFSGVQNVAIVNASDIGGWFAYSTWYPINFNTFNVIFYESSHNLVANDTFLTQSAGLLFFQGANNALGDNTVWGSHFVTVANPSSAIQLIPKSLSVGLQIAENNSLVYNNYFNTSTTAWLMPANMYTGNPELWTGNVWNVTPEPANASLHLANFPLVNLTGSIIGTSWQGGNFWWDYGNAFNQFNGAYNPYGALPYIENASTILPFLFGPTYYSASYIFNGGDFAPLTPLPIQTVTFTETGLAGGTLWGGLIHNGSHVFDFKATNTTSFQTHLPNGTGYALIASASHPFKTVPYQLFSVNGSTAVGVAFNETYVVNFTELGLYPGTTYLINVTGTGLGTGIASGLSGTSNASLGLANGTYHWSAYTVNNTFTASPATGNFTVAGAPRSITTHWSVNLYNVTFNETGLPSGTWTVTLGSTTMNATAGANLTFPEVNGTYAFVLGDLPGFTATPESGMVVVNGSSVLVHITIAVTLYAATFTAAGLPASVDWTVTIASTPHTAPGTSAISVNLANGTYAYALNDVPGWHESNFPYAGSFTIAGSSYSSPTINFTQVTYAVTFSATGEPAGTNWSVTIVGGATVWSMNTSEVRTSLPNGTWFYTVGYITGFYPSPAQGQVSVIAQSITVPVRYVAGFTYTISFQETGLAPGGFWVVSLNGSLRSSTVSSISFVVGNGTYAYLIGAVSGFTLSPSSGSATVSGASVVVAVSYTAITYYVELYENGLASGTNWSATFNGHTVSSVTNLILYPVTGYTLVNWNVTPIAGFGASPGSGFVVVSGSNVAVLVTFSPTLYAVTFTETGLTTGTVWAVTLNGVIYSSNTATITAMVANNSYAYFIGFQAGFTATPSTGNVVVAGSAPAAIPVVYTP